MSESATQAAIEIVARNSYGQLIAYIAARSGDVAGAEDALGDAFVAALERPGVARNTFSSALPARFEMNNTTKGETHE